ncbi:DUF2793 domain-containing protein [Novosphingobium aquae]|uniref:DUF2793 domain-containing protein n=1 Tax=Novosphingobium aquae TaxID=3133435 RepID=UPI003A922309
MVAAQADLAQRGAGAEEAFVNGALVRIDALLHARVEGVASSPPTSPVDGDCWIVGANPQDEWAGKAANIACGAAGNWLFVGPQDGMSVAVSASGQTMRYRTSQWSLPAAVAAPQVGVTVDSQARTAISDLLARLIEAACFLPPERGQSAWCAHLHVKPGKWCLLRSFS